MPGEASVDIDGEGGSEVDGSDAEPRREGLECPIPCFARYSHLSLSLSKPSSFFQTLEVLYIFLFSSFMKRVAADFLLLFSLLMKEEKVNVNETTCRFQNFTVKYFPVV